MSDAWKIFGITLIVLIAVIALILIFAFLSRECNTNVDCPETQICTNNHKCVAAPPPASDGSGIASSLVIAIAVIIAAIIIKSKFFTKR